MRIFVDTTGKIWKLPTNTTVPVQVSLPAGVTAVPGRIPVGVKYKTGFYLAGPWSKPLIITQDVKVRTLGIEPPPAAVTIAAGTASGGINTAACFVYITFAERLANGRFVADSNPNSISNVLNNLTNASITVTGIPTTCPNARVNWVRIWRSDGGAIPKLAGQVPLGVSSFTDTLSTVSLATREPLPTDTDGDLTLERGVPPQAKYLEIYHERMWSAGGPQPHRLYYSKLFEPEAVGALNFIETKDGEAITGLKRAGDVLIVFTKRSSYLIQGWSAADFRMQKIHPSIGCISHYSIVNINERLWFVSEQGVYLYDGGFRFLMDDIRVEWRTRLVANPNNFDLAYAQDDREWHVYRVLIPYSSGAHYYVANYEAFDPSIGSSEMRAQPRWTFDSRTRYDRCQGLLSDPGTGRQKLYTGSDDGFIRAENVYTNSNDDSDSAGKLVELRTKHYTFDDPGGDAEEGRSLTRVWSYVKAEDSAWTFRPLGGDEEVSTSEWTAGWSDAVAASAVGGKVAKTRHFHPIPEKVHGHGFTFVYKATSPLNWSFRGLGGITGPGTSFRAPTT